MRYWSSDRKTVIEWQEDCDRVTGRQWSSDRHTVVKWQEYSGQVTGRQSTVRFFAILGNILNYKVSHVTNWCKFEAELT